MNIIIHRGKGGFQESAGQPSLMYIHMHMQTHTCIHTQTHRGIYFSVYAVRTNCCPQVPYKQKRWLE